MRDTNKNRERKMREAFREAASAILTQPDRFVKKVSEPLRMGFESEVAVLDSSASEQASATIRDTLLEKLGDAASAELGATQIEFRTRPFALSGITDIEAMLREYGQQWEAILHESRELGADMLRIGANPFLNIRGTQRTDAERYRLVPDFHNRMRPKDISTLMGFPGDEIDVGDAAIVGLFQAFHINIEATSFENGVELLNRALILGPYIMALGGNARHLECTDTGFNDLRFPAWELSHETRTARHILQGKSLRVGLPARYVTSMDEYFSRILEHPFILHNPSRALAIGLGLCWHDARLKIIGNSIIMEFRMLPTQPTVEEEIALALFLVGRLLWGCRHNEPLLPIALVRENRTSALTQGLHSTMWFYDAYGNARKDTASTVVREELNKAEHSLCRAGLAHAPSLDILKRKLADGSASDVLTRTVSRFARNTRHRIEKSILLEALRAQCMLVGI